MNQADIEINLLKGYEDEIRQLVVTLAESGDSSERYRATTEIVKKIQLYEKQLEKIRAFNVENYDWFLAQLYYFQAQHVLLGEDLLFSASEKSLKASKDIGEAIILSQTVKFQQKKKIKDAIPYLTKALSVYDGIFYRFFRADLYFGVDEFSLAINDIDYLLENLEKDDPDYINARKKRDEYEIASIKKNEGCLPKLFTWALFITSITYLMQRL